MRESVGITIVQKPIEVIFTCTHCGKELEIDYEEFENMTSNDLSGIIYDNPSFKCPKCNGELYVGQVNLD